MFCLDWRPPVEGSLLIEKEAHCTAGEGTR